MSYPKMDGHTKGVVISVIAVCVALTSMVHSCNTAPHKPSTMSVVFLDRCIGPSGSSGERRIECSKLYLEYLESHDKENGDGPHIEFDTNALVQ